MRPWPKCSSLNMKDIRRLQADYYNHVRLFPLILQKGICVAALSTSEEKRKLLIWQLLNSSTSTGNKIWEITQELISMGSREGDRSSMEIPGWRAPEGSSRIPMVSTYHRNGALTMKYHCLRRLKPLRRELNESGSLIWITLSSIFASPAQLTRDYTGLSGSDKISNELTANLRSDVVPIVHSAARFPQLSYGT